MHDDRWRRKRVVWRKHQRSPVLAVVIWGGIRSSEDVMPFQNVGFGGVSDDIRRGVLSNGFVFSSELAV